MSRAVYAKASIVGKNLSVPRGEKLKTVLCLKLQAEVAFEIKYRMNSMQKLQSPYSTNWSV